MRFSAKQIAAFIQGEIIGDENATVHTFAKIEEGMPGAISFLSNPKYTPYIYETQSSIVLVNKDFVPEHEIRATLIKVDNAYESLAKLLNLYEMRSNQRSKVSIHWLILPPAPKLARTYTSVPLPISAKTPLSEIILKFTRILSLETV